MTEPRSKAAINATPETKAIRTVGRIKTLRAWLKDAEAKQGTDREKRPEKVLDVKSELAYLEGKVAELKAELDSI